MNVSALGDNNHTDLGINVQIYCTRGIMRTTLNLGNVAYGIQIVHKIEDANLWCECVIILVSMNFFTMLPRCTNLQKK